MRGGEAMKGNFSPGPSIKWSLGGSPIQNSSPLGASPSYLRAFSALAALALLLSPPGNFPPFIESSINFWPLSPQSSHYILNICAYLLFILGPRHSLLIAAAGFLPCKA